MTADVDLEFWLVAALIVALVVIGVWALPRPIDYGACLASHAEHRHQDAYLAPVFDYDGDISLQLVDATDWDVVVCDRWEFPNGRLEAAP